MWYIELTSYYVVDCTLVTLILCSQSHFAVHLTVDPTLCNTMRTAQYE